MLTEHSSTSTPPEHQDDPVLWEDRGWRRPVHSVSRVSFATLSGVFPLGGVFCGQKVSGIPAGQCLMWINATRIGVYSIRFIHRANIHFAVQRSDHMIGTMVWACQLVCLACLGYMYTNTLSPDLKVAGLAWQSYWPFCHS